MSRNGTPLELPAGWADALRATWPGLGPASGVSSELAPRSWWLSMVEEAIRTIHPAASRADLNVTARGIAPFYLAEGPNVP